MMTDQPERQICAEIIREKALLHLREEVPHGIGVEMMAINKLSDNLTEIHATIYCERASHKGIIIGKQGAMLRTIGAEARRDIENLLGTKVNLQLWVKVREDWLQPHGRSAHVGLREQLRGNDGAPPHTPGRGFNPLHPFFDSRRFHRSSIYRKAI